MRLAYGEMWSAFNEADLFLITTNSKVVNGKLVMGAGIALEAERRYNGLNLALGRRISNLGVYGLLVSERWPESKLGAFQTKLDPKDPSPLWLIHYSALMLDRFIRENPVLMVHLNFPGIGYGGRTPREVMPLIEFLPDNVVVWEKEEDYDFDDNDWRDGHPDDFGD